MIDVEPLIGASFDRMLPEPVVVADWGDVLGRAGVRRGPRTFAGRRRYLVVALALLALVGVVGAAYALDHPIVQFGTAPHARSRTVVNFFGRMTLFGGPKLQLHQTRRITDIRTGGHDYVLRIAPERHRGFCYAWSNSLAGCDDGQGPTRVVEHDLVGPLAEYTTGRGRKFLTLIAGSFRQAKTDRIVLTYADGRSSDIPFVWVTAPIREGFYVFGIPRARQRLGRQPVRIALLDRSGHPIDRQQVFGVAPKFLRIGHFRTVRHRVAGYPPLNVPLAAEWAKRAQLFRVRTDTAKRLGLWVAPARKGGPCYWSSVHAGCGRLVPATAATTIVRLRWSKKLGAYTAINPPASRAARPRFWLKVTRGHGYVALCCTLDPRARRAKLIFQDGDHVTVTPKSGYLIWPIPHRHYRPGHRLDDVVLYNGRGRYIGTVSFDPAVRALYPCAKPKNYGFGFRICP